jgi:hypothetical protein
MHDFLKLLVRLLFIVLIVVSFLPFSKGFFILFTGFRGFREIRLLRIRQGIGKKYKNIGLEKFLLSIEEMNLKFAMLERILKLKKYQDFTMWAMNNL